MKKLIFFSNFFMYKLQNGPENVVRKSPILSKCISQSWTLYPETWDRYPFFLENITKFLGQIFKKIAIFRLRPCGKIQSPDVDLISKKFQLRNFSFWIKDLHKELEFSHMVSNKKQQFFSKIMPGNLGMFSTKHGYIYQVSGHSAQECEMHLLLSL